MLVAAKKVLLKIVRFFLKSHLMLWTCAAMQLFKVCAKGCRSDLHSLLCRFKFILTFFERLVVRLIGKHLDKIELNFEESSYCSFL